MQDKHGEDRITEWQLHTTSVVILGAGFSVAATDGKLPSMSSFFDTLEQARYPKLHDFVVGVASSPDMANVESVLVTLDQIRTSPDAVLDGWASKWKQDYDAIQRELVSYTLARLKGSLDIPQENWAANLLATCGPATTVISMNYDNIAERILSNRDALTHRTRHSSCPHCKMRTLLHKACSCEGRKEILDLDWRGALVKPHGSVAWRRCLNPECCSYECLVADEHCRPFEPCGCPNCQTACAPVLVMPTMSKNLEDTPEIGIMWQAARKAISDAESILFFGFSMPTSDELLTQMIRSSIYETRKLRRIACIDLDPTSVLQRVARCVPSGLSVSSTPFPVVRGKVPDWLSSLLA